MVRSAARVDANQRSVIAALRECGWRVLVLSAVGGGCPDILVGAGGRNFLLEIKDGSKPPGARKLTPDQMTWHSTWTGQKAVVFSPEHAVSVIMTSLQNA
jgi:Holliday junction resolvase